MRRTGHPWHHRRALVGAAYAAPAAVIVTVFFLVPLALVLWMSLNEWPLIGEPLFNAPANYAAIAGNALFVDAVLFTLEYTAIVTVVLFGAAFGLALLVQRRAPGVGFFRTAFFLPGAVGFATASLLFYGLLSRDLGPLNPILSVLGVIDHPVSWVSGSPNLALASTIGLVVWRFAGFNMLILLNGLQAIPEDVYEAARVDGAGSWLRFRRVTLPLLSPAMFFATVIGTISAFQAFGQIDLLTEGGPANHTRVLTYYLYQAAFKANDDGRAAVLAIALFGITLVLTLVQLRFVERRVFYGR